MLHDHKFCSRVPGYSEEILLQYEGGVIRIDLIVGDTLSQTDDQVRVPRRRRQSSPSPLQGW
jgi:hypothetical protein